MEAELSSSVIGGLLIGFFALLGIGLTDAAQKQRDKRRQLKTTLGVLHAVKEELKEIYSVLDRRDVKKVWEEIKYRRKDFFTAFYPIPLDYLIIYRSNANHIGQIENSSLRGNIVSNYMMLQSLMERYRTNNSFLSRYHDAKDKGEVALCLNLSSSLRNITKTLREEYDTFKNSTQALFKELEEELARLEKELAETSSERFWENNM